MKLAVEIAGLRLKNPLIAASGTFGYGVEYEQILDLATLGGIVSKGLYLGTATQPKGDGTRTDASGCFVLTGPFNPWVGVDDPQREAL